jgi:hypothetical protein
MSASGFGGSKVAPKFARASEGELKSASTDPISRFTRVSFDSQEFHPNFYSIY